LLILPVLLILRLLTGQLNRAAKERERLLRSAIDASDAERRRIARDLHDGVVQELAGTAFSVSALARDAQTPEPTRPALHSASVALRDSLKSLRSLLAEIHPPELHPEGLPAALDDLIAPAAAAGIQASVSTDGVDLASDAEAALVWRVAQEAVRNALRHSGATTLAVTVRGDGERLALDVVDDGSGFDPHNVVDPDRYGLRGLRSLVRDVGGELEVISAPGEGTTVRMEVDIT
jgi:signal transduction histidine kinase